MLYKTKEQKREALIARLDKLTKQVFIEKNIVAVDGAYKLFEAHKSHRVEHFFIATLNSHHDVIDIHCLSKGTVNRTLINPRDIFKQALLDDATAIILCHNHPSGSIEPSDEDKALTRRISQGAEILGLTILDHIIIGKSNPSYFSFVQQGLAL